MFGYEPGEGPQSREAILQSVHPDDLPVLEQKLADHLAKIAPYYEAEYRRLCKDGSYKWVLDRGQALWESEGTAVRMAGSLTDIMERKQLEEKLFYFSMRDSLTGLYNRAYFQEELRRLNDGRYSPLAVIVCDVDGLKLYNDSFGHQMGDRLIKTAADLLQKAFRSSDVVARIGGDEFAVLLPRISRETVDQILLRLKMAIQQANEENPEFLLGVSIGMAISHSKNPNLNQLFREADHNMYREKSNGGRRVREAITKTVLHLLEQRDYVAEGHTRRVSSLCEHLAREMGLPADRIHELKLLAQYHDLGKVGVTEQVLFKQEPLNDAEKREVQRHCEIGHRIAQSMDELKHIADWILKHQEWWDGNGYPIGLAGDEIPLECRILAIADAYDSMINERPYRKALSHEAAMRELRQGAGTQFDPFLVELFSRLEPGQLVSQVG